MAINEEKIVEKILQLENKMDDFQDEIKDDLKKTEDRIISVVDSAMKKMSDVDQEQVMTRATLDRHEGEIIGLRKKLKVA